MNPVEMAVRHTIEQNNACKMMTEQHLKNILGCTSKELEDFVKRGLIVAVYENNERVYDATKVLALKPYDRRRYLWGHGRG